MPKILQVSTRHNVGGISKLIIELLGDSEFEQVYVTGTCENNEKEYSLELTSSLATPYTFTRIRRLKRSINFTDDVVALFLLIKIIRQEQPDIIHTHMSKAGLLGRIAVILSFSKVKTVHSYHGHVLDGYFNKIFQQIIINFERILGTLTDAFIFDGQQTLREINEYGIKPKKIQQVILPGLVKQISKNNQNRVNNKKLHILVVARIEKVKRVDLVLEVARNLTRNYPTLNYEINIVGDGELRQLFERQSTNELLPIKFVGWRDSVNEYYEEANLLLSTSDSEGTPLSFMEAASFGCPIISTNVGSVADLIDDHKTGILCESNSDIIAKAILFLWQDRALLEKYSQNSLFKASNEFTADKFISKHSQLYKSLLS
jgi:glycosyltransferase involved in cell wall biosynthesis